MLCLKFGLEKLEIEGMNLTVSTPVIPIPIPIHFTIFDMPLPSVLCRPEHTDCERDDLMRCCGSRGY